MKSLPIKLPVVDGSGPDLPNLPDDDDLTLPDIIVEIPPINIPPIDIPEIPGSGGGGGGLPGLPGGGLPGGLPRPGGGGPTIPGLPVVAPPTLPPLVPLGAVGLDPAEAPGLDPLIVAARSSRGESEVEKAPVLLLAEPYDVTGDLGAPGDDADLAGGVVKDPVGDPALDGPLGPAGDDSPEKDAPGDGDDADDCELEDEAASREDDEDGEVEKKAPASATEDAEQPCPADETPGKADPEDDDGSPEDPLDRERTRPPVQGRHADAEDDESGAEGDEEVL